MSHNQLPIDDHIVWREDEEGVLRPQLAQDPETLVTWAPMPGSQTAFLRCPATEVLYEGTRGPGKTDSLLMAFAQFVGVGFGDAWRGIIFRRSFPELSDVISKSLAWFTRLFPEAKYNRSRHEWEWPTGEVLMFRYMRDPDDYWQYHGHAYPFLGWEELTNWPSDECYSRMISTCRSTNPKVPQMLRATANPYGPGHNWVKARFRLDQKQHGRTVGLVQRFKNERTKTEWTRAVVHGYLRENIVLLHAQPDYEDYLRQSARNENMQRAWMEGAWDIVAGGMFDDVWDTRFQLLPDLVEYARRIRKTVGQLIPRTWRISLGYDHGQSRPFSAGFYAVSNGEPLIIEKPNGGRLTLGPIPGDVIRFDEIYGWTGNENEGVRKPAKHIAREILQRCEELGIERRVRPGIADSSIFDSYDGDTSVAGMMEAEGLEWEPADKAPGSRVQGWELMRDRLMGAVPEEGVREEPGLFVTSRCEQFIRTVPVLLRDPKNPDDADTTAEDHVADEVRYFVRAPDLSVSQRSW